MNLLEAEKILGDFKPHISYLAHGTVGEEEEAEQELFDYLALKTRIFEAKDRYHLTSLEFSLDCLEDEKQFYNLEDRVMLYKDFVSDTSLNYCRKKLAEIDEEIDELKTLLEHRKELARL